MKSVVRFDAELLVHQATGAIGCSGSVVVDEPAGWGPPDQTVRRVRRCVRPSGHPGLHRPLRLRGHPEAPASTLCGLSLTDGAWIDWRPSSDDPRCPACHGETEAAADAVQGALL